MNRLTCQQIYEAFFIPALMVIYLKRLSCDRARRSFTFFNIFANKTPWVAILVTSDVLTEKVYFGLLTFLALRKETMGGPKYFFYLLLPGIKTCYNFLRSWLTTLSLGWYVMAKGTPVPNLLVLFLLWTNSTFPICKSINPSRKSRC